MRTYQRYIFAVLTVCWIMVIFSFSLQPAEVSSDVSSGFGKWFLETFLPGLLKQMEELPAERLEFWHTLLRKGAHFTEYFVLGVLMLSTFIQMWAQNQRGAFEICGKKVRCFLPSFILCVLVASVDETIQLFVDGRAGRIADVLLDGSGAFVGQIFIQQVRLSCRKARTLK